MYKHRLQRAKNGDYNAGSDLKTALVPPTPTKEAMPFFRDDGTRMKRLTHIIVDTGSLGADPPGMPTQASSHASSRIVMTNLQTKRLPCDHGIPARDPP